MGRKARKKFLIIEFTIVVVFICSYLLQNVWAHRHKNFVVDYPYVALTEETDYETFFLQTGLGKTVVEELLKTGNFQTILRLQDSFRKTSEIECKAVLGWFTMSDRVAANESAPFVDLQSGDIILSVSTHSLGWRHGHAGLVIDEESVLECLVLGKDSAICSTKHWRKYSNYIVLRVEGVSAEDRLEVARYAKENLCGAPYHLSSGFLGEKAPNIEASYFGLQCAYLVWYAWYHFGYDLDSDGGRLVTPTDLLQSELLEVIQIYGMDPRMFLDRY